MVTNLFKGVSKDRIPQDHYQAVSPPEFRRTSPNSFGIHQVGSIRSKHPLRHYTKLRIAMIPCHCMH